MDLQALDITNFLPHRYPFLMVDKVLSIDDEHVATSFCIASDCIFVENGSLNEAGMIENAAQTCSSIVGKTYFEDDDITGEGNKLIGFISAIKKVNINACPPVGATVETRAELQSRFDADGYSISTIQCKIILNNEELLSCIMNLFIQEVK
jgi:predicted hotdog family 3-hydroxylacyl-ACP dehydratase